MIRLSLEIGQTQKPEAILFYILAPLAVLASLGMLVIQFRRREGSSHD